MVYNELNLIKFQILLIYSFKILLIYRVRLWCFMKFFFFFSSSVWTVRFYFRSMRIQSLISDNFEIPVQRSLVSWKKNQSPLSHLCSSGETNPKLIIPMCLRIFTFDNFNRFRASTWYFTGIFFGDFIMQFPYMLCNFSSPFGLVCLRR
jgi:hypothetical protein